MPNPIGYNQLFDIDGLNDAIKQAEGTITEFEDTANDAFTVVRGNAAALRKELEKINAVLTANPIKLTDDAGQQQVVDYAKVVTNLTNQIKDQQKTIDGLTTSINANKQAISDAKVKAAEFTQATKEQQLINESNRGEIVLTTLAMKQLTLQRQQDTNALRSTITPYKQVNQQLNDLKNTVKDLGAKNILAGLAFDTGEEFKEAQGKVAAFNEQVVGLDKSVGNSQRVVGEYERGQSKLGATIDKVTNIQNIGSRVVTQFSRQLIGLVTGVLSAEIGAKAIESLVKFISTLRIFNPLLTETQLRAKDLNDAFASADYSKAVEGLDKLQINIGLANQGFLDKDKVVDEYNASIGKVAGNVDTLNQAEQGLVKNGQAFIKITLLKAAAELALADAAKTTYEAAQLQQKRNDNLLGGQGTNGSFAPGTAPAAITKYYADLHASQEKARQRDIDDLNRQSAKQVDIAKKLTQQIADIQKKAGLDGDITGTGDGVSATAALRNKIANEELEQQKVRDQSKIDNEKNSYSVRIAAAQDFANADKQIAKNNEDLQLTVKKLSANQKLDIEKEYANKIAEITNTSNKQIQSLNDKRDAEDLQHLKNRLQKQLDAAKSVLDSPGATLDQKQAALDSYNNGSQKLNKAIQGSELSKAGNNTSAQKLANDNFAKADSERTKFYADESTKILEDTYNKQEQLAKNASQSFLAFVDQQINLLKSQSSDRQLAIEQDAADAILGLDEQRRKGAIDEQDYQQQLRDIDNQSNKDKLDDEIKTAQQIVDIRKALVLANVNAPTDVRKQLDNSLAEAQRVLAQLNLALTKLGIKVNNEDTGDILKNRSDVTSSLGKAASAAGKATNNQGVTNLFTDASSDLVNGIPSKDVIEDASKIAMDATSAYTDFVINQSQKRQAALEGEMNYEIQGAGNNALAKQAIEAEYTKMILAEKQKQAKLAKAEAAVEIILNTAVAATKVTAQTGLLGIPLIPVILALGAAELGLVLAQPIPQYATGRDGGNATFAEVNERGPEALIKGNRVRFANKGKRGITFLEQGEKVITADRTNEMINNQIISADKVSQTRMLNDQYISSMSNNTHMDYDKMASAFGREVSKLPLEQNEWNERGHAKYRRIGNTRIKDVRNRNRLG